MLRRLEIRNIVLIERLALDFEAGLTVLTGETGAGKSILLDALGFALGARGRRELVSEGTGTVTAVFAPGPGHGVWAALEQLGIEPDGAELVFRRVVQGDGPARGFVNDQRIGAEAMAGLAAQLVEVHGQHDDRGLMNPRAHRGMLDGFAGLEARLGEVRAAWAAAEAAAAAEAEAREALAAAAREADYLTHAATELRKFSPAPGEDAALDGERRRIQAAARIGEEVLRAGERLEGDAEAALADALQRLTRVADRAEGALDGAIGAIERAMVELGDAAAGVRAARDLLRYDPARLEQVEDRLFALRALARKHAVPPDDLAGLAADMIRRLDALGAGEARIGELAARARAARAAYEAAAARLTAERTEAAARLDRAVTGELGPLRMEAARFETRLTPGRPGPEGSDEVAFTAQINPGAPAGPIDRIASGGELSRFLLALKVCLAARAPGQTMIFDEIDRGIGGQTADAVGRRLARLAETAQVLVVTHSPQVAAMGARHLRIAKSSDGRTTRTEVQPLGEPDRVDEIARMLAGDQVTAEARAAARALIAGAAAA